MNQDAIWRIMEPTMRAGETYPLARDMGRAAALAYWHGPNDETFVVEDGQEIVGTYHLFPNWAGPGAHVANIGYMTASAAMGRGVGPSWSSTRCSGHAIEASKPWCSTTSPARTNAPLVSIRPLVSKRLELYHWLSSIRSEATLMSW